jgi:hypothetical protein
MGKDNIITPSFTKPLTALRPSASASTAPNKVSPLEHVSQPAQSNLVLQEAPVGLPDTMDRRRMVACLPQWAAQCLQQVAACPQPWADPCPQLEVGTPLQ